MELKRMEIEDSVVEPPKSCFGVRHVQVLMLFFGMTLGISMRVNMSVAIVAMTDNTSDDTFDWDLKVQSVILSSFFWGYMVLQVPAGELASRFGGKALVALCIGSNALASLLLPLAAYYGGWMLVCGCRVFQGLFQGFLMPATHQLMGKWAPSNEKSRLGMFVYSGAQFGIATQFLTSGFIADTWGWQAIFYSNGAAGITWTILYLFIGADTPQSSQLISVEERLYIQKSLGHIGERKKLKTPWKALCTSTPFLILILVHMCQAWSMFTLMTEMPSYISNALGVDIKENGVLSALPYIVQCILSAPFGVLSDYALKRKWACLTATRKISNTIGFYGPALALIILAYSAPNLATTITLLCVAVGLNVGHITGFFLAHIDMAPNFAGTMMGITNGAGSIMSVFAPLACGAILKDETDHHEWRKVFYLAAAFYILGNTLYLIFGTSERQAWNNPATYNNDTATDSIPHKSTQKKDTAV